MQLFCLVISRFLRFMCRYFCACYALDRLCLSAFWCIVYHGPPHHCRGGKIIFIRGPDIVPGFLVRRNCGDIRRLDRCYISNLVLHMSTELVDNRYFFEIEFIVYFRCIQFAESAENESAEDGLLQDHRIQPPSYQSLSNSQFEKDNSTY